LTPQNAKVQKNQQNLGFSVARVQHNKPIKMKSGT